MDLVIREDVSEEILKLRTKRLCQGALPGKVEKRVLLSEALRQENFSEELKEDHCGWNVVRKGEKK